MLLREKVDSWVVRAGTWAPGLADGGKAFWEYGFFLIPFHSWGMGVYIHTDLYQVWMGSINTIGRRGQKRRITDHISCSLILWDFFFFLISLYFYLVMLAVMSL